MITATRSLFPLLLASCEAPPAIVNLECTPTDERAHVAACVVPSGAAPGSVELDSLREISLTGATVIEAGTGTPPEGCLDLLAWVSGQDTTTGAFETAWVTVEDAAGEGWTLSVTAGGPSPDLSAVTVVDLVYTQADQSPFAGEYGETSFTLTDATNGALLAWMQDGGGLSALDLPEGVSAVRSNEECREEQECGTDVWYRADITLDGETVTLRPGGRSELSDVVVSFDGELEVEEFTCSETSDGSSGMAVLVP